MTDRIPDALRETTGPQPPDSWPYFRGPGRWVPNDEVGALTNISGRFYKTADGRIDAFIFGVSLVSDDGKPLPPVAWWFEDSETQWPRPEAIPETYHAELDPPGPVLKLAHAAFCWMVGLAMGMAAGLLIATSLT